MPFARAAVRQTGGRTPLGLVEKGMGALIVSEVTADVMVMQAIKKAYEERGVKGRGEAALYLTVRECGVRHDN
jgi:hypothetical protein